MDDLQVGSTTINELLLDLEFAVRQHIDQKKPETAARVRLALKRIDTKREENVRKKRD